MTDRTASADGVQDRVQHLDIAASDALACEGGHFQDIDQYLHELGRVPSNDLRKSMRRLSDAMDTLSRTSSLGETTKSALRHLPPNQVGAELQKKFLSWDKDQDGHLCRGEIVLAMSELGREVSHEEVEDLFSNHDNDQDGHVDIGEFEVWVRGLLRADKEAERRAKERRRRASSSDAAQSEAAQKTTP